MVDQIRSRSLKMILRELNTSSNFLSSIIESHWMSDSNKICYPRRLLTVPLSQPHIGIGLIICLIWCPPPLQYTIKSEPLKTQIPSFIFQFDLRGIAEWHVTKMYFDICEKTFAKSISDTWLYAHYNIAIGVDSHLMMSLSGSAPANVQPRTDVTGLYPLGVTILLPRPWWPHCCNHIGDVTTPSTPSTSDPDWWYQNDESQCLQQSIEQSGLPSPVPVTLPLPGHCPKCPASPQAPTTAHLATHHHNHGLKSLSRCSFPTIKIPAQPLRKPHFSKNLQREFGDNSL